MQVHYAAGSGKEAVGAGNLGSGVAPVGCVALGASKTEEVGEGVAPKIVHLPVGGAVMAGIEPVGWPATFEPAAPDKVVERIYGGIAHVLVEQQVAGRVEVRPVQIMDFPFLLHEVQRVQGRHPATTVLSSLVLDAPGRQRDASVPMFQAGVEPGAMQPPCGKDWPVPSTCLPPPLETVGCPAPP